MKCLLYSLYLIIKFRGIFDVLRQNNELITVHSRYIVIFIEILAKAVAYVKYQLVAVSMPPCIIEGFKIIEIDVHNSAALALPERLKSMTEKLIKGSLIGETRKFILISELFNTRLIFLYFPIFIAQLFFCVSDFL